MFQRCSGVRPALSSLLGLVGSRPRGDKLGAVELTNWLEPQAVAPFTAALPESPRLLLVPTTNEGDEGMETRRQGAGLWVPSTTGGGRVLARRQAVHFFARVSRGLVIGGLATGLSFIPAANAGAAGTIKSSKAYAQGQLLKLSNLPSGWTKSGGTWVGTSGDNDASSMLTMTQYPDFSTCLGEAPALSVVATEASSPEFDSNDQNTSVLDVADVYSSSSDAKADFPPLNNPKFANCFLRVQGSSIMNLEQSAWPSGSTFGTPAVSISRQLRYGNQSGLIEVQVPVNLPGGEGATNDFFVALVIRQGRSTAELLIDQGDTTPPASLTESLAKAVTAKMKAPPSGNTVIAA